MSRPKTQQSFTHFPSPELQRNVTGTGGGGRGGDSGGGDGGGVGGAPNPAIGFSDLASPGSGVSSALTLHFLCYI